MESRIVPRISVLVGVKALDWSLARPVPAADRRLFEPQPAKATEAPLGSNETACSAYDTAGEAASEVLRTLLAGLPKMTWTRVRTPCVGFQRARCLAIMGGSKNSLGASVCGVTPHGEFRVLGLQSSPHRKNPTTRGRPLLLICKTPENRRQGRGTDNMGYTAVSLAA